MPVTFDSDPLNPEYLEQFYRRAENTPWKQRGADYLNDPVNKFRLHVMVEELRKINPARLLDVGCGAAALAEKLAGETAVDYVGCDLAVTAGGAGNGLFVEADAAKLAFSDCIFDAVVCSEVLEHLPEPARALSEIGRVLVPGGFALITVPNWFSLDSLDGSTGIVSLAAKLISKQFKHGVNVHLTKMFPAGWKRLIEESELTVEFERPVYLFPYIPYLFKRFKEIESGFFSDEQRFGKWMKAEEGFSSNKLFSNLGQFHFFRCKKK